MLTNISWSNYIIAVTVLTTCWYIFLGFRYYQTEFKHVLSGRKQIRLPVLGNKKLKSNFSTVIKEDDSNSNFSGSFEESVSTLEDAEELSKRLLTAVNEHSQSNRSKEEFTNYVKLILTDYPFVKNSSLRKIISNKLVLESEKHPQIVLSYIEADALWNDTI